MIRSADKTTTSQAIDVLVIYIMAAGILTLPRTAVEEAGTPDVWISVLLGGRSGYDKVKPALSRANIFSIRGRHCRKVAQYCDQPAFH